MTDKSKILIADDEPRMLKSIELLLAGSDFDIRIASSGRQALEIIRPDSFDLFLLDMNLGDMHGFQVMEFIQERCPDSAVIFITGDASIESAVTALKKGAYSYLKKPFEPEELINTVRNAADHMEMVRERMQVNAALQESELRFRNLVENYLVGICIIQEGRIVYQNPQQQEIFAGLDVNRAFRDFAWVHPEDRDRVREAYRRMASNHTDDLEISFRFSPNPWSDGHAHDMKWVNCRASRFIHQGEDAILVNMMDDTRFKILEQQVMIRDKMSALGRVAAGIAHEIRNPLTGINSYLYTLQNLLEAEELDQSDVDMSRRILTQIQTASNKIEGVIKRVLDFSKPSHTPKRSTNLNQALEDALKLSSVTLRRSGIDLDMRLDERLPSCLADSHQIEQVLLNLINNAAQSLVNSTGRKRICLSSETDGKRVILRVADSGPGVPPEIRTQIFDPFFTTKAEGSGIGLSLAQRILTDHKGSIYVSDGSLGGAEFTLEIPITNGDVSP